MNPQMRSVAIVFLAAGLALAAGACAKKQSPVSLTTELLPVPDNPLIHLRVVLRIGSANDPAGKEGLTRLTLSLLADGGTRDLTIKQITERFFPLAARVQLSLDKEMASFSGTVHRDNLDKYYVIFRDMLLNPGFRDDDFDRLKTDQLNYLEKTLVNDMDEEFGKEILNLALYEGHPYGHKEAGTVESVKGLTLDDVKAFYKTYLLQGNIILGVAGGYPEGFPEKLKADFAKLPEGATPRLVLPAPAPPRGLQFVIAEKPTPATAISLGFPVAVSRADKDFFALWVAGAHFGEHRQHLSHLFQVIREQRGQNYGDYAYVEHFIQGRDKFPDVNYDRQQQFFSIWIRPLSNANRHFVIRQALRELRKLVEEGVSEERLQLVKAYLLNYTKLYAQTLGERLGWQIDSRYYGYEDFLAEARERIAALSRADVNAAIKKYLNWQNVRVAVITQDAQALKDDLVSDAPSRIKYANPNMPQAVLDEDLVIQVYRLDVKPEQVRVAQATDFFRKPGLPPAQK
jgi:zinc protease